MKYSIIRFAEKGDLKAIKGLMKAHAKFEKSNDLNDNNLNRLGYYMFNTETLKCLVVELNNKIVGYATFIKQFSTWDTDFYIYLDCLFLNKNARGNGFGGLLIEKIKEYAKNQKCSIIQWQTPDFNRKAIDFYRKIGGISKSKERFCLNICE